MEYLGMPEKTVETWQDLWFHTGDALRRDEKGWYYFVDRVKDALRRRGENISSFEVESVVRSHAAIAECAVVGAEADEPGGENEVKAFVVLNPGMDLDYEDLAKWCDARMPAFMVPRYVEVIDVLPQTPSQKVQKKELRDRGNGPATWDRNRAMAKA
jgi:crotonobetaine/carnitine-CoA ligase